MSQEQESLLANSDHEKSLQLTQAAYRYELLDAEMEKKLNGNMNGSAQAMLWAVAEPETLDELQTFLSLFEEELDKSKDIEKTQALHQSNIYGLIDEIEVLLNYPSSANRSRLSKCTRKLKVKLSRLNPAPYLIIKYLSGDVDKISTKLNRQSSYRIKTAQKSYFRNRNKMVNANLRLVFMIASKFRHVGLSYDDLVQEGNLGLIKAIEYYDAAKGYRFSTYAYRVISQAIHSGIEKHADTVRKPFLMLREKQQVSRVHAQMEQRYGRPVTSSEVAQHLTSGKEFTEDILGRSSALSADDYEQTNHYPHESDLSYSNHDQGSHNQTGAEIFWKHLSLLPERTQNMIIMRYGIGLRKDYTLEEISQQNGLSRERVRQLIKTGLEEIKNHLLKLEEVPLMRSPIKL